MKNKFIKIIKFSFLVLLLFCAYIIFINGNLYLIPGADLIFHEAGHTVFIFFGETIHFLGGTFLQLLIPLIFAGYFLLQRNFYAMFIMSWWLGENLVNVGRYMSDARAQLLPLLGGENVTHDWHFLFSKYYILEYDTLIGGIFLVFGFILMIVSIILAGWITYKKTG